MIFEVIPFVLFKYSGLVYLDRLPELQSLLLPVDAGDELLYAAPDPAVLQHPRTVLVSFRSFICSSGMCLVTQKLPQICTVILRIRIGKVAIFAVYICGNFWVTQ